MIWAFSLRFIHPVMAPCPPAGHEQIHAICRRNCQLPDPTACNPAVCVRRQRAVVQWPWMDRCRRQRSCNVAGV